jgi:hypothetical protein
MTRYAARKSNKVVYSGEPLGASIGVFRSSSVAASGMGVVGPVPGALTASGLRNRAGVAVGAAFDGRTDRFSTPSLNQAE